MSCVELALYPVARRSGNVMAMLSQVPASTRLSGRFSAREARAWLIPLVVAVAAWGVNRYQPLLSALLVALAVGAVVANVSRSSLTADPAVAAKAKFLLRLGIALLGLRLALSDIAALGWFGVLVVLATVTVTFKGTQYAGRRLGLDHDLTQLIAAGFSICGAAAVAAVQDSVKAAQHKVAIAIALVTLYGTAALVLIPLAADWLGFDDTKAALWAGASIHEVAQVVAAAAIIGGGAPVVAIAMSVKLGRVLMLAPVHHSVMRANHDSDGGRAGIPWFLWAFLAAVALRATDVLSADFLAVANAASTICLAAGMFGLGLGLVLKELLAVPGKAVLLATIATAIVTVVPLTMILVRG